MRRSRARRSKSLGILDIREIGRKEAEESAGLPGLWMGMIVAGFQ